MNCPYCHSSVTVQAGSLLLCVKCRRTFESNLARVIDRINKTRSEFCPKCGHPVERAIEVGDDDRLCEACGWFGGKNEVLDTPPKTKDLNPTRDAAQILELFRDACRQELVLEQAYDSGDIDETVLKNAKISVRSATHQIIELFVKMKALPRILATENGTVAWPDDWTDRHYNASHDPCDMLVGPCSCGAWHYETEGWVVELLKKHNTIIES